MVDGILNVGSETIGVRGTGTFDQEGGTHTTGSLVLGQNAGSSGTYYFTGGTLNDDAIVGDAGIGVFNNSGGTHNVTGDLILGNQATGDGTYNLSGTGSLNVTGTEFIGAAGTGTFMQTGGTNTANSISVGNNLGGIGTYTLSDGPLTVTNGSFVGAEETGLSIRPEGLIPRVF